jgi:hypothetical protein
MGTARAAAGLPVLVLASCAGLVPAAGYPWIEDPWLALDREVLRIGVEEDRVLVDALFAFDGGGRASDRVMSFPVPGPGSRVVEFEASLAGPGLVPLVLETGPSSPGLLPAGRARQSFDILVPGEELERHAGRLLVRYVQGVECGFSYVLSTGACWRGPVGSLEVIVVDGGHRVREAGVLGEPPHAVDGAGMTWSVEIALSCGPGGTG